MTFTDDDLAQLKNELADPYSIESEHHYYEDCNCCDIAVMVKPLLTRLEAAEAVIHHGGLIRGPGTDALVEAWRKAAEREG